MTTEPDDDPLLASLAGRTILRATEDDDDILLELDDGRIIEFVGLWQNDSTAGVLISESRPL